MRKFLILLIINIFVLVGSVNADMEGPRVYEAEMFVSNENGTKLYNWNLESIANLNSGTMFTTDGVFENDGNTYYQVNVEIDGIWEYGYVNKDDVSLRDTVISEEGFQKNEDIRKVYVWKDECYLYKGPSEVYDKVIDSKIPEGTILEYQYVSMEEDLAGGYAEYIYTTYNGVNGWVRNSNVAKVVPGKIMIPVENAKLLKEPNEESEIIEVIIPKYTELDVEYAVESGYDFQYSKEAYYEISSSFTSYVHVKYKGINGWIHSDHYATPNIGNAKFIIVSEDASIYNESGESFKLPYLEEIEYKYCYSVLENLERYYYYYLSYNGIDGWINRESIGFAETEVKSLLVRNEEGAKAFNAGGDIITIPYFTQIDNILYKYYDSDNKMYIVEYDNEKVIISANDCMEYVGEHRIYFVNEDINMYEKPDKTSKIICQIPKNSKISEKYENDRYTYDETFLYIEYNGIEGWIYESRGYGDDVALINLGYVFSEDLAERMKFEIYTTNKELEAIYYNAGESIFETIPENSNLAYILDDSVMGQESSGAAYVLYNNLVYSVDAFNLENVKLVAKVNNEDLQKALEFNYNDVEIQDIESGEEEFLSGDKNEKEEIASGENIDATKEEYTPKKVAIIGVIVAIILAITATVTIKLINKKDDDTKEL